jgi:threonine dehydratase
MPAEEKRRGVVCSSAGNHAQGVALAARIHGIRAVVCMAQNATRSKVAATKGYGAEVVLYGNIWDEANEKAKELVQTEGLTYVHPFDDEQLIAGQGTLGLEIVEDAPDVSLVIVGCGGGGLLSGVSAAIRAVAPRARVVGVEPKGADAMRQSLAKGEPVRLARLDTIADGLAAPFAGVHTLAHVKEFVSEMVLVDDDEILDAMRVLMRRARILPEPAGAAATAALLDGTLMIQPGEHVVVVVSGGNADPERLRSLL